MTAPAAPARAYVWPSRILVLIAALCLLIAALTAAGVISGTSVVAWALGGACAFALSWAVP